MSSRNERRSRLLHEMGLSPQWVRRDAGHAAQAVQAAPDGSAPLTQEASAAGIAIPPGVAPDAPAAVEIAAMDWAALKNSVAGCVKCGLCHSRTRTVFGVGDEKASWLFVGEGPGRSEDQKGEPFVGPAGKLLDNMLVAMGLRRGENAYIANIVKCRPADENGRDRPPTPEKAAACLPYLERQIALIQPDIIVALGKTAAMYLLGVHPDTPVSKLRGTVHEYANRPLVVTYHPAYLLRNMADKKKAWADLCLAMSVHARQH